MTKKKHLKIKRNRHVKYVQRKSFFRKHGRKQNILLGKKSRKERQQLSVRNKEKKIDFITKEPIDIKLPEILSLESEYRTEFLEAIEKLRYYLPSKKYKCSIDHSKIVRIDPEALLVLAAEIKRSVSNHHKIFIRYNKAYAPKDEQVIRMLNSIGYWKHFNIQHNDEHDKKRKYLKIIHDITADNMHVVELREFFANKLNFLTEDTAEMFDDAISEAIANSVEHAYIKKQKNLTIDKAWWLSGSYNIETKELFFGCYDQGIGVKDALGHHDNRLVKKWVDGLKLMTQKDSEVIEALVTKELPKYKDTDRGHGFKHFIKFIQDYSLGSLNIYSKNGECKFIKQDNSTITKKFDYNDSLNGTLIVWKIKISGEINDSL